MIAHIQQRLSMLPQDNLRSRMQLSFPIFREKNFQQQNTPEPLFQTLRIQ
jgi:hypothetical protein